MKITLKKQSESTSIDRKYEWRLKYKFLSPKEYFESQLFIELKEMFSRKRKNDDLCAMGTYIIMCASIAGKRNIFLVLIK